MSGDRGGDRGTVVLVGAGLGGALLSILLGRSGFRVRGYEMRPDPRKGPSAGSRSINLALSARGLHALQQVGLADAVLARAVPMRGRMIHDVRGATAFQPYGTEAGHVNQSVSRSELNAILLDAAEREPNVRFAFGRKCTEVDLETGTTRFETTPSDAATPDAATPAGATGAPAAPDTARGEEVRGDVVLGADGAFSMVRRQMMRIDRFDYRQDYLSHGYKELTVPPAPGGGFLMEAKALHIWPRGGFMMIALPNRDGSFTCTLFWPHDGPNSFAALRTEADVAAFFRREFPDAVPLMPDLAQQYLANPIGSLVTIRCRPWHHRGRVGILGDAAHAVVPFHGQGANCAFEDCLALDASARRHAPDWERALTEFEAGRKENADALAALSLDNFVEMRDHTASRMFRARKAIEKTLYRLFPASFMPLYMMISFSRIPYAETIRRARRQSRRLRTAAGAAGFLALFLLLFWLARGR